MSLPLRLILGLAALAALISCDRRVPAVAAGGTAQLSGQAEDSVPWLVGPEPRADLLHADASEASLRARFGPAAVRPDSVYVGEGFSEYGTLLFPDDSARRLAIVWTDTALRSHPEYVYVSGTLSTWRLYPGVGIGTDLKTLESLNGGPFQLAGFGWDYSGTTGSFNGGRLDTLWRGAAGLGSAVLLRLDPATGGLDSLTQQVEGDRMFSSGEPAMQRLNPRIYQILVRPR